MITSENLTRVQMEAILDAAFAPHKRKVVQTPIQNEHWQRKVHRMLGQGLGSEDIAVKLKCPADKVRLEITILRETHQLARVLKRNTTK